MLQSVYYFCGKLFVWKADSEEIIIKKICREECEFSFKEEEILTFPIKNCIKCGMTAAGKCLKNLYVIAESYTDSFEINICRIDRISEKWQMNAVGTFRAECSVYENIYISDEPLLLWTENNLLKIFKCEPNNTVSANSCLIQVVPCQQNVETLLQVSDIDVNSKIKSVNGVLLLCWKCENEISIGLLVCLSDEFKPVHVLPIDHFVPEIYKYIISAIKIDLIVKNQDDHCSWDLHDDSSFNWFSNFTIVCTEKKQFILFINGAIKYSCNIPYSDIYDISKFDYCLNLFQTFYILQSLKGSCAITKCDHLGLLKIHCCWDDSLTVLSGDFCQRGSLQLMIFTNFEPELITETCIITDIFTIYYPRHIESLERLQEPECSYALEGMKRRLKAGKMTLSEIHSKQIDLQRTIEKVFNTLESNNLCDEGQKIIDRELIDLTASKTKPSPSLEKRLCSDAMSIIGKWNVLLKDHWILGWSLLNQNDVFILDINVHLYHEKEIIEYKCKWYKHHLANNQCWFDFAQNKIENMEFKRGDVFSVVASIPLSIFTGSTICVISYVKWKTKSIFEPSISEKHTPLQWNVLNIKNIFDENSFKGLNFEQKLMSLRILQENRIIGITSSHTDLSWLERMLFKSLNLEVNCTNENFSSKVYIFMNPWNPIFGGNFSVRLFSPNKAEINFYFRETTQLLIFIRWLQDLLPEDINIHAVKNVINVDKENPNLNSSLKEELQLILSFVHENSVKNSESCQLDAQLSHMCLDNAVLDFKEYCNFRFKLLEKELETDEIVAQLSL
ncbi:uncharacterized protein LOC111635289 isoform X2 [Centruroides sculpturatus]|uniref:uncharacterized protein LOC111635289 isoform X2 n=1 Tax=Centruroides sculpturatus TaxID=218467 RepID=UPI000C6DAEE5|nr:uncharacterized protein LOC111635289 isoform X2 [Centruroides sculpturatus]